MKTTLLILFISFLSWTNAQDKFIIKGDAKMEESAYEDAIKFYSKSIEKSQSKTAFNKRAECYLHINNKSAAIDDYSTSLEIDESQLSIWIARGKIYLKSGKFTKAEKDFSKALEIDPKNKEALVERGEAYSKLERLANACEDWAYAASLGDKRGLALLKIRCEKAEDHSTDYLQNKIRK